MIGLPSPVVLKYRLVKYRNELLGDPVLQRNAKPRQHCSVKIQNWQIVCRYAYVLAIAHVISQLKYRPTSVGRMVGLSSSHKYSTGQARSGVQAIVSARSYFLLSLKELVRFFLTRSADITRDYFSFSTSNILIFYIILTRWNPCVLRGRLKYLRLIASACIVVIGVANGT